MSRAERIEAAARALVKKFYAPRWVDGTIYVEADALRAALARPAEEPRPGKCPHPGKGPCPKECPHLTAPRCTLNDPTAPSVEEGTRRDWFFCKVDKLVMHADPCCCAPSPEAPARCPECGGDGLRSAEEWPKPCGACGGTGSKGTP